MLKDDNLGYIFDIKKDCEDAYGLITVLKINTKDNIRRINITIGVDTSGNIVPQSKEDITIGFSRLNSDEIETRLRGNKSFFSIIGDFALILSGILEIDILDNSIITNTLQFYVQKQMLQSYKDRRNANGDIVPVVVCDKLTTEAAELNSMLVNSDLLQLYMEHALDSFTNANTETKLDFLKALV